MNTWNDLLDALEAARAAINSPSLVWYRGHDSDGYSLRPSLMRFSNGVEKEQDLFHKFHQRSRGLLEEHRSDWEILFDMRHYSVPTRLLDWTDTLGVALYFALAGNTTTPCVWLLDPLGLNVEAGSPSSLKRLDDAAFAYKKVYWEHSPIPMERPLALEPVFRNARIQAQSGMFTIHGRDVRPLEESSPARVAKVSLPPSVFPALRLFLEHANLNEFSLFPDLEGLGPFIKRSVGLR